MNETIRVGVVGYGYWGSKHVRVLASMPEVELYVIDAEESRLLEATAAYPVAGAATRLEDVLEVLDAVLIATPPASHAPLGLQVIEAGKHCFIEKPLSVSVADAESLVCAAEHQDVRLMVGHTFEYNAAVWKLKELVDSDALGEVLYIDAARLNLGLYQPDCNVVWDLAPHDLSIITYLLDEMPSSVAVWADRNVGDNHVDVAHLRLEFDRSQAVAHVHVSWLDPRKVRRVTVAGNEKIAVYNDVSEERVRVYDSGVDVADAVDRPDRSPFSYRNGDIVSPEISFPEPLFVQDKHFLDCVRTGAVPRTDGQRGLDIVRILEAADRALASGHPASVSESIPEHNGSAEQDFDLQRSV
jgi:predicted dehydrogenase